MLIALLLILLSGICYRVRGSEFLSSWSFGATPTKCLIGAAPRGLGVLLFAPLPYALVAWVLSAIADRLNGHAAGQGFGGVGDDDLGQARTLLEAGIISAAPVGLTLLMAWCFDAASFLPAFSGMILAGFYGAMMPLAYWLGWHTRSLGKPGDPWYRRLLRGTEYGELFTGMLLGMFVWAA